MNMKKLATTLLLTLASTASFANCSIEYIAEGTLKSMIIKEKFNLNDNATYNNLCNQLKKNKAGVFFETMNQFSPYQMTTFVSVRLYDVSDNKNILTMASTGYMKYNNERTTSAADADIYSVSMHTLAELAKDQKTLDKMFTQIKEMRSTRVK